jgi:hypothetical protein
MMDDLDAAEFVEALEPALRSAAAMLESAHDGGVRERELEDALERALESGSGALWAGVQRQRTVRPASWQGRVGPVDLVAVDGEHEPVVLIEAKLGGSALWNCAWDLAKLAVCSAEGIAPYGALVAAASSVDWEARGRGVELFEPRSWELSAFLRRYAREFSFWREDVANWPRFLPPEWRTFDSEPTRFSLAGEPWELRGIAVDAVDPALQRITYVPVPVRTSSASGDASAPPHPDGFFVSAGSGLGSQFEARWDGDKLEYQAELRGPQFGECTETVRPSDATWRAFWSELDALDVWAWDDRYEPLHMATDGYAWEVRMAYAGRSCDSLATWRFPAPIWARRIRQRGTAFCSQCAICSAASPHHD